MQTSRMTVTAPASDDSDAETGGVLTLVGYDTDGKTVSADLRVGIGRTVDLTGQTLTVISPTMPMPTILSTVP